MKSYMKYSLLLTVAGCFVAMSASARIIKITDKNNALGFGHMFDKSSSVSGPDGGKCFDYGYYEIEQPGAKCTKVNGYAGATCYRCTCDESVYRVAENGCASGLVEDGNYCSLGTTKKMQVAVKRYEGCKCDSSQNYFLSTDYIKGAISNSAFTYTGATPTGLDKTGANITCYQSTKFVCNGGEDVTSNKSKFSGSNKAELLSVNLLENYMTYSAASTMNDLNSSNTLVCTTGVVFDETVLFMNEPNINDCAKTASATAKHYKKVPYYYHTECSTTGRCLGQNPSNTHCHDTAQPPVILHSPTTGEIIANVGCVKTKGCLVGAYDGYQCLGTATSTWTDKDFFSYTDVTRGSSGNEVSCRKVTGCATGYTKVAMTNYSSESALTSVIYAAKTDATGGFDVRSVKATNGSNVYATVCKIQNGCNVGDGYYNVADSWLKYFEKD